MNPNPFATFHEDWALLTAGTADRFNSMTLSWGAMGTIWGKPTITVYVRPDRYTWRFLQASDIFTVSFYPPACRRALEIMGTLSGRDTDKPAAAGLTPLPLGKGGVTYGEATETFVCKKIYMAPMHYADVPPEARPIYQKGVEPHYLIMGEVIEHRKQAE